ncbi:DUF998 domain-containing protein [Daejeonella sp.]|uniref:DUF998 domain-containing protein n=1 Tax=Daejeonella sp. TaxID=2805397 RepID=UPI002CE76ADD|nr:DUF998 domain-containing protein [Daejeonella sp.]HQT23974.1 DUF998 domain-containing protein [Daejeonella sp.]HQT58638.1 DUF998 domain-containing protein [Daejeonella sp.]
MRLNQKTIFICGILGAAFFVIAWLLAGLIAENYDPVVQLISESMSEDRPYSKEIRYFGYIPAGILLMIFALAAPVNMPKSKQIWLSFYGIALFYGLATITVGIFPCEAGCNKEMINPGIAQVIHNLSGLFTYIGMPICLLLIGFGLKKADTRGRLSQVSILLGTGSAFFILILFANPLSPYAGLFQRIIEGIFVLWIIGCSISIKNHENRRVD